MRKAFFPGSFDPFTNGHLDVVEAASKICDEIIIAIGVHSEKKGFLTYEQRKDLIKEVFDHHSKSKDFCKITLISFKGLSVEAAQKHEAHMIIRGIRNSQDCTYEMQMAGMNHALNSTIPTFFIPAKPENCAITSTLVRQIWSLNGDITKFIPKRAVQFLKKAKEEKSL